ncbi:MAG: PKD domain-containing protein [Proteobacteria bacterium]|nr:PKD domain-containing protein [Pseudomonadota bacterium]
MNTNNDTRRKRRYRVVGFIFLIVVLSGCMDPSIRLSGASDSGELKLAFTVPTDVDHIDVQLYEIVDATNALVSEATLGTGELTALFIDLKAGDYYVEAQAYDQQGAETYAGQGGVYVHPDILNNLVLLWMANQNSVPEINAAPKIEYVDVLPREIVTLATDLDAGAEPGLYVITPGMDESVEFIVATSDADGDPLAIAWTIKDGPNPEDNDVGTVCGTGDTISWSHDVEGKYYVQVHVSDGRGGNAVLIFDLQLINI